MENGKLKQDRNPQSTKIPIREQKFEIKTKKYMKKLKETQPLSDHQKA